MQKSAFTLIELLVVIVIIGVLATIGTATFSANIEKSRQSKLLVEWTNDQKDQSANCIQDQSRSDCSHEVQINGQVWAGFDTKIGTMIAGNSEEIAKYGTEKVCIDENESNCDANGGLYSHAAAITMCPDGWKLPTTDDFDTLVAGATSPSNLVFQEQNGYCEQSASCAANAAETLYMTNNATIPFFGGINLVTGVSGPDLNTGTVTVGQFGHINSRVLVRCIKE